MGFGRNNQELRTFVDHLDTATVHELQGLGRWLPFETEQVLSRQGEAGDAVLIVQSGVVKVTVVSPKGKEVLLNLYGPGELLGEVSALQGTPRSATVIGHLPGRVLQIPTRRFRDLVTSRPEIFGAILAIAGQRLRRADLHRLSYAGDDVACRVGLMLLSWGQRYGSLTKEGLVIGLRASRRELAQAVIASEKTVDDALTLLKQAGLVSTGRRRFVITDPVGLHRWVELRSVS